MRTQLPEAGLSVRVWVEAARPPTLPAVVAPVLVGTAAADRLFLWRFLAALVVGLALQVGVNYANDYFDAVRGVDRPERVGPRRAVAAGLVAPAAMRTAMIAAFAVGAVAGLALALAVGFELLLVGGLAILAAIGYSGGPRPYASAGLGELSVFVFFGLVATAGSQYVQDDRLSMLALLAAVPVGLLAVAILIANNLRDIRTDAATGKHTLAVRLGAAATRRLYAATVVAALLLTVAVTAAAGSPWPLLSLAAAPLAVPQVRRVAAGAEGTALVPALVATVQLHLAYGALLAVGLLLAR